MGILNQGGVALGKINDTEMGQVTGGKVEKTEDGKWKVKFLDETHEFDNEEDAKKKHAELFSQWYEKARQKAHKEWPKGDVLC